MPYALTQPSSHGGVRACCERHARVCAPGARNVFMSTLLAWPLVCADSDSADEEERELEEAVQLTEQPVAEHMLLVTDSYIRTYRCGPWSHTSARTGVAPGLIHPHVQVRPLVSYIRTYRCGPWSQARPLAYAQLWPLCRCLCARMQLAEGCTCMPLGVTDTGACSRLRGAHACLLV